MSSEPVDQSARKRPMIDEFSRYNRSLVSPPEHAANIAPDDASGISNVTRALYVGGTEDLRVRMLGGETVTFANIPSGTLMPLRVTRVFATGTTATAILGLW
jgi:hypothetical protein